MLSRGWKLGKKGVDDKYEEDLNNVQQQLLNEQLH